MQHRGCQFPGDLEHVREHQQQSLRRGERGRQRTGLKRSMDRPGSPAFTLHFEDGRDGAPEVFLSRRRPRIRPFAHRGRGRDRINGDDFVERVSHSRDSFVCVDRLKFLLVHGVGMRSHSYRNVQ